VIDALFIFLRGKPPRGVIFMSENPRAPPIYPAKTSNKKSKLTGGTKLWNKIKQKVLFPRKINKTAIRKIK
jgi:hypothetical protein